MHWSGTLILGGAMAMMVGCSPAIGRPLRGAQPGSPAPTAPGLPPTLEPAEALRLRALASPSPEATSSPSPGVDAAPSPGLSASASALASPSVAAAPPIVRTIVPAANGSVATGSAVTVSAVLVGRGADLASASLAVDGADAGAQIDKQTPRQWSIHVVASLSVGTHTARVLVRDAAGANGGFTWNFT
ncbi:MAG: hypothetical protein JOZ81_05260, partial [Chloroflexi bacterium]|nr:hypothetical protein [Chloroflexota bacterium]